MKQTIKLTLALILMLTLAIGSTAQTARGDKTLGPKLGYITENKSATASIAFTYTLSDHFRLAPEIGCVFRNKHRDAFTADLNAHFPLDISAKRASLYPILGLNFSAWTNHLGELPDGKDVSDRQSRVGANFGAGFGFKCNSTILLSIEAKYCLLKNYSSVGIAMGLAYIF